MARRITLTGLLLGAGVTSTLTLSILPAAGQDVTPAGASTTVAAAAKKQGQGPANPVQPAQPSQDTPGPSVADTSTGGVSPDVLGSVGQPTAAPRQAETTASPGTNNIAATPETASRASTDVGDFL